MLEDGVLSLRSRHGIETLLNMKLQKMIVEDVANAICRNALIEASRDKFLGYDADYIAGACYELVIWDDSTHEMQEALRFLVEAGSVAASNRSLLMIKIAVTPGNIGPEDGMEFVRRNLEDITSDEDISDTVGLLQEIPEKLAARDELITMLHDRVIEIASDSLAEFVEITDAFSGLNPDDEDQAEENLIGMIETKFDELGFSIKHTEAKNIARSIDVKDHLDRYIMNSLDRDDGEYHPAIPSGPDEIDDLFDRG